MPCKPFISYAKEDRAVAERLCADLRELGADPWLDVQRLRGGEEWRDAIVSALRDASHILILISAHSVSKIGFVQAEVRLALDLLATMPPQRRFIIPIRLDDSTPSNHRLSDLQWINLHPNYFAALTELAESLDLPTELGSFRHNATRTEHRGSSLHAVLTAAYWEQSAKPLRDGVAIAEPMLTNTKLFRAILNPKLYELMGKSLRLTFVKSARNRERKGHIAISDVPVECTTVLGQYDLILAHLGDSEEQFRKHLRNLVSEPSETSSNTLLSFFGVSTVRKHRGFVTNDKISVLPDVSTIAALLDAAGGGASLSSFEEDWLDSGYILGVEPFQVRKGIVEAYILVSFDLNASNGDGSDGGVDRLLAEAVLFDQRVFSVYQGSGSGTLRGVQVVLKTRSTPEELFEFINGLHYRCDILNLTVRTNTCIAVATTISRLNAGFSEK
jgi:hypothetical protein